MEMMQMVELLGPELYMSTAAGGINISIWESSPKTLRYSMDGPMKMFQRGWQRSPTSSTLTEAIPRQQVAYAATLL